MEIKTSVITVTYNNGNSIQDYLESLSEYLPENSEVIIVDNHSTDDTVPIIENFRQTHKKIVLIKNEQNYGFSVGNNLAAQKARGGFLLILNPDIKITKGSLESLLNYLETREDIGIIAPKLIMEGGKVQPSVRKLPTLWGVIAEYYLGRKQEYDEYVPESKDPVEVEAVYGAAMLMRSSVFQEAGGFDEKYFVYYEDLDLCRRIKKRGYKVVYYPGVPFLHAVGGSRVGSKGLPWAIRTLANFIPIKQSGKMYYQVLSGNRYHGLLTALIIRILIYIAVKTKI